MRRPDGAVEIDPSGTAEGRGAYLCAEPSCWRLALRRRALERALGRPLPAAIAARLEGPDAGPPHVGATGPVGVAMMGGTHGA